MVGGFLWMSEVRCLREMVFMESKVAGVCAREVKKLETVKAKASSLVVGRRSSAKTF
jgi:hypothetical protein